MAMIVMLWLSLFSGQAQAAPGDLDTSFNGTGVVSVLANDLAVLRSGRIVVVSDNYAQPSLFILTQYMTNGQLDTGFGSNGVAQTAIHKIASATAIAQQADLKLIVAGWARDWSYPNEFHFVALARYLPNGQLDGTFGNGGIVTFPGTQNLSVTSLKILASGSILVAVKNDSSSMLLRFTSTGQLDSGFGVGGVVNVTHGYAESLTLQADGRILVAGIKYNYSGYDSFLARYTAEGAADPSFGIGGVATKIPAGTDSVSGMALAVQPDGKILVGSGTGRTAIWLLRYLSDGTLDPAFGNAGSVTTSVIDANGVASIVIQADGKILAIGSSDKGITLATSPPIPRYPTLVRYLANGQLDTRFATNGKLVLNEMVTAGSDPPAQALALQHDGKILIAGAGIVRLLGDPVDATRTIPTLSSYGLALLAVLMALAASWAARRRGERP